jgi:signal transduction histidine kinase
MSATEPIQADSPIGLRLVEAADEGRRQLERDLHDGAQQRLVLASLTLSRAAAEARGTPAERSSPRRSTSCSKGWPSFASWRADSIRRC